MLCIHVNNNDDYDDNNNDSINDNYNKRRRRELVSPLRRCDHGDSEERCHCDSRGFILDHPLIVHPRDKMSATRIYRARHVDCSSTSPTRSSSSISDDPSKSSSFFRSVFTDFGAAAAAADSAIISRDENDRPSNCDSPQLFLPSIPSQHAMFVDMLATCHSVATSGRDDSSEEREEFFIASIGRILDRLIRLNSRWVSF